MQLFQKKYRFHFLWKNVNLTFCLKNVVTFFLKNVVIFLINNHEVTLWPLSNCIAFETRSKDEIFQYIETWKILIWIESAQCSWASIPDFSWNWSWVNPEDLVKTIQHHHDQMTTHARSAISTLKPVNVANTQQSRPTCGSSSVDSVLVY
jgi:hypothetical protein